MEAIRYDEPEFGFQCEELDSMTDIFSFEKGANGKPLTASSDDLWGAQKPLRQLSEMLKRETSEPDFNDVLIQVLQCEAPSALNDIENDTILSEFSLRTAHPSEMKLEVPCFESRMDVQRTVSNSAGMHEVENSVSAVSDDHLDSPTKRSPPVPVLSKKERVCHICGYEFMWPNRLRLHMRKHNDDKPLQCKNKGCDFRGKWNSGMAYHMKHHCKFNSPAPN